jgi:xylulokinase
VLLPKDYIRYRLTGDLLMEVADASGSSLLDCAARTWSDEILTALDIPRAWLPDVVESPTVCGAVSADISRNCAIPEGLPIVAGAGDQAAEAIGCGIVRENAVSVTIGTSGVVFAALNHYSPDALGELHGYCHAIPDRYHVMGVMLSAGGALRWHRDALGGEERLRAEHSDADAYDLLIDPIADIPPGAEGLTFLPYLAGERTPHPDPYARGAFIGLTLRHAKAHMTRAVLEGVTFGLLDSVNLVRDLGVAVNAVRISGGGARNAIWRQMLADAFNADAITVNATEGAAFGAAILAAVGAQMYDSVESACDKLIRETSTTAPDADAHTQYMRAYDQYRALYPALKPHYPSMTY